MEEDRYTRITLRLPKELHARLDAAADATSKSLNAEIVGRLELSFEIERRTTTEALMKEVRRTQLLVRRSELRAEHTANWDHGRELTRRIEDALQADIPSDTVDALRNDLRKVLLRKSHLDEQIARIDGQLREIGRASEATEEESGDGELEPKWLTRRPKP